MGYARHDIEMEIAVARQGCPPETNLWLAVVQEVISTEPVEKAERWLASKDGRMVAAMAGLDTDWLIDRILPAASCQATGRTRRYARQRLTHDRSSAAARISTRAARHEYFRSMGWIS